MIVMQKILHCQFADKSQGSVEISFQLILNISFCIPILQQMSFLAETPFVSNFPFKLFKHAPSHVLSLARAIVDIQKGHATGDMQYQPMPRVCRK